MIESTEPSTWQELEADAARILTEAGFQVEHRKEVSTVRGSANVDLVFTDMGATPPVRVLLECKRWADPVDKSAVLAFRAIVNDAGAHSGLLLSTAGFQSGAKEAAAHSNIRLITWRDFEDIYEPRWTNHYLRPSLQPEFEPLVDLTDPLSSVLLRRMAHLDEGRRRALVAHRDQFSGFAIFALSIYRDAIAFPKFGNGTLPLPLRTSLGSKMLAEMPPSVVDITAARAFGEAMIVEARSAIASIEKHLKP